MYLFNFLILLASCVYESQQAQMHNKYIFKADRYHWASNERLLKLMRSYYEEAGARIKYLNPIRFMYEESPYYEMGYIMGEIIERYRKVIEHAQKPLIFHFYTLFDMLKHLELIQKLYFELYHLVRMLHEVPRKWRGVKEFEDIELIAGPELIGMKKGADGKTNKLQDLTGQFMAAFVASQQRVLEMAKHRAKEKRRQKKKFQKARQQFLLHNIQIDSKEANKKPRPWPIDYGWEIDASKW